MARARRGKTNKKSVGHYFHCVNICVFVLHGFFHVDFSQIKSRSNVNVNMILSVEFFLPSFMCKYYGRHTRLYDGLCGILFKPKIAYNPNIFLIWSNQTTQTIKDFGVITLFLQRIEIFIKESFRIFKALF